MIRWLVLGGAVIGLLQGTLLFHFFDRHFRGPWPHGAQHPRRRALPLLASAVLVALWWYLGTPSGRNWLERSRRGPAVFEHVA
jgi:hypothetical protein